MGTQLLAEPPLVTEHDTEPMCAVRPGDPEQCGVCGKPAMPLVYCHECHTPLCRTHVFARIVAGFHRAACPEHARKGA